MKFLNNLKIATKLIGAFIIVSIITVVVGAVGFLNLREIGNQKLQGVKNLLEMSQAFTEVSALENLVISPNISIEQRAEKYLAIDIALKDYNKHKSVYLDLNLTDEEKSMWKSTENAVKKYFENHDALIEIAHEIDDYQVENPAGLKYIVAAREKDHFRWIWLLTESIIEQESFSGQLDGTQCALGKWLSEYDTNSPELIALIDEIDAYHIGVHDSGEAINNIIMDSNDDKLSRAYGEYQRNTLVNMNKVLEILGKIDVLAARSEALYVDMTSMALEENDINHSLASEELTALVDFTSEEADKAVTSANIMIIIFTAIGTVVSIALGIFISGLIKKPIAKIVIAANDIADGNLDVEVEISGKDEIGDLAVAFNKMSQNMNNVMTNINGASDQVASGSRQLSDSSMSLSQGATEQASSIEELTASIEEIATQTLANSENAEKAKTISNTAYNYAEKGNNEMKDMLVAMSDINESSSNISKIIKVIDDIAFQTNILALNAAVEAARAGQHGKGFAVVAEEVRNLAARSADAAKETTTMIEGSIKKVERGTALANQTAEALNNILNGVSEAADIVGEIAVASLQQSHGVEQVNLGLNQISDVVQTTSATAEETAAASEELSGQADMLKAQVAKFQLRSYSTDEVYGKEGINPDVMDMLDRMKETPATKQISLSDNQFDKY